MNKEVSKLEISFRGISYEDSAVEGNLSIEGDDYFITNPIQGKIKVIPDTVKLIPRNVDSILKILNDAVDLDIVSDLFMLGLTRGDDGNRYLTGAVYSKPDTVEDMLYAWSEEDQRAGIAIVKAATKVVSAHREHNCSECKKESCPKHPKNPASLLVGIPIPKGPKS